MPAHYLEGGKNDRALRAKPRTARGLVKRSIGTSVEFVRVANSFYGEERRANIIWGVWGRLPAGRRSRSRTAGGVWRGVGVHGCIVPHVPAVLRDALIRGWLVQSGGERRRRLRLIR